MQFRKFLTLMCIAALIAVFSVLTASAQCPNGQCYRQPQVIYAPAKPVFNAPIRRAIYEFMTPQGVVMQGYYIKPVTQPTPEQIRAYQAYWNEKAAQLAPMGPTPQPAR